MLSRKQIKTLSLEEIKKEYKRVQDLSFNSEKSYVWTDYKRVLRKELELRKGNKNDI